MIKLVDSRYSTNQGVRLSTDNSSEYLIIDADSIIFLKHKGEVLLNKYENDTKKENFDTENACYSDFTPKETTEIYEFGKNYLHLQIFGGGYRFKKYHYFKGDGRVLALDESLPLDYGERNLKTYILTREEVENFFDKNNYDSMYLVDREAIILYAWNKQDGTLINKKLVPTDERITEIELRKRQNEQRMKSFYSITEHQDTEELEEVSIYKKAFFHGYYTLLITTKNGEFDVNWLGLDFIEKDKFRLILGDVPITEPTIDYVIDYINKEGIHTTISGDKIDTYMELPEEQIEYPKETKEESETIERETPNKEKKLFKKFFKNNK